MGKRMGGLLEREKSSCLSQLVVWLEFDIGAMVDERCIALIGFETCYICQGERFVGVLMNTSLSCTRI